MITMHWLEFAFWLGVSGLTMFGLGLWLINALRGVKERESTWNDEPIDDGKTLWITTRRNWDHEWDEPIEYGHDFSYPVQENGTASDEEIDRIEKLRDNNEFEHE